MNADTSGAEPAGTTRKAGLPFADAVRAIQDEMSYCPDCPDMDCPSHYRPGSAVDYTRQVSVLAEEYAKAAAEYAREVDRLRHRD